MQANSEFSAPWRSWTLTLIGIFCGAMTMTFLSTQLSAEKIIEQGVVVKGLWLGCCVLGPLILFELRQGISKIVASMPLRDTTRMRFLRYEIFTYLIFLGYGLVLAGLKANTAFAIFIILLFALAQLGLLWWSARPDEREQWSSSLDAVPLLFFISGFAALIYQVVWQRILFATFGVNIESVTVIVSVFMFGLGIGALIGGLVQKYFPRHLLGLFIAIEIAIGLFGICSIPLIHAVGRVAPSNSLLSLIGLSYALLALPTMLMGATLPLLVGYLQKHYAHLGALVGKLYAYNTFGSALAAFLTVMLLFVTLGQQSTLVVAAICNAITACFAWYLGRRINKQGVSLPSIDIVPVQARISYVMALILSVAVGYVSLSLEILWFRIIGFMSGSRPQVFGTLLAVFLAGIASGSLKSKRYSESGQSARDFIYRALLQMALITYFAAPVVAFVSAWIAQPIGVALGYGVVWILGYFSGGIFPLLCHMGIALDRKKRAGMAVAWVYFLNIVGATFGALITGFILLDSFSLGWNMIIVSMLILSTLVLFLLSAHTRRSFPYLKYVAGMGLVALALWLQPTLYDRMIEKLQGVGPLKYVQENRTGIITVGEDIKGDPIYGNGAYDGRSNIDPANDSNRIDRAYMVAALHPHPKRILEIGLSGGAWARVLTSYQPLQELTSVEINPGYLDIIKNYPDISPLLRHPKWRYAIDDGRRWLVRHPSERFDVIVMNTTYYWRSNSTNLLSHEFLSLAKDHLEPGGVLYYNHTGARDSAYTAAHVFEHVAVFQNMVVASDSPLDMSVAQKEANLEAFADENGREVFTADASHQHVLQRLANEKLEDIRAQILAEKNLRLITDDNMAAEYKIN